MSKAKIKPKIIIALETMCSILPSIFWGLILFGFEEVYMAFTTLLCALIHELGHIVCVLTSRANSFGFRGVVSGFRIRPRGLQSYDEEILTYLSGPLANIYAFVISIVMSLFFGRFFLTVAIINLATALSNLLPIKGYDGYGAIKSIMKKLEVSEGAFRRLSYISSALIFIFCIFSLYLIDRQSGGYWIFAVFFISMVKEIKERLGE